MPKKFKHFLSEEKTDTIVTTLLFIVVFIAVAYKYSYYAVFFLALYLFSLGTIIYNGIKLYGFLKKAAIEKSYKAAYADFFSVGSLLYFFVSTLIVVVACMTIFSGMPNVYLLTTSFFVVFAVILYDLLKK